MNSHTNTLPSSISSPQDLTNLILEIEKYNKWYLERFNAISAKSTYKAPQPDISRIALDLIISWDKQEQLDPERINTKINELRHISRSAPVITITLAAPAPMGIKNEIVSWCRQNLNAQVLVSFQFNSTILGGIILRTGSKVYDWSFKHNLLNVNTTFTEVLDRV